jgi:hypothetical protein
VRSHVEVVLKCGSCPFLPLDRGHSPQGPKCRIGTGRNQLSRRAPTADRNSAFMMSVRVTGIWRCRIKRYRLERANCGGNVHLSRASYYTSQYKAADDDTACGLFECAIRDGPFEITSSRDRWRRDWDQSRNFASDTHSQVLIGFRSIVECFLGRLCHFLSAQCLRFRRESVVSPHRQGIARWPACGGDLTCLDQIA